MLRFSRFVPHLSYANVTATLALFVSLGGASYATLALPADSVGSRQLRPRGVTARALAFPLGAASIGDSTAEDLAKGACNSAPPAGGPPVICYPPPPTPRGHWGSIVRPLHMTAIGAGRLVVSVIATLRNTDAVDTSATVTVDVIVNGFVVGRRQVELRGGEELQTPVQAAVNIRPGRQTIGLVASAFYSSSSGPGDVSVGPVSLIGVALPRN